MYAWIITHDHLDDDDDAVGVSGPSDASDAQLAQLARGEGHKFELYDDDRIKYYTGRLVTDGEMTEDECFAPLGDFGEGYAGCVAVIWPGHPEWDCG